MFDSIYIGTSGLQTYADGLKVTCSTRQMPMSRINPHCPTTPMRGSS